MKAKDYRNNNLIWLTALVMTAMVLSCKPEFPYDKRDFSGSWCDPVALSPTYDGYMVVEKDSSGQRYLMRLLNPKTYRMGTVRTVKLFYDQYSICGTIGRDSNASGVIYSLNDSIRFISDTIPHPDIEFHATVVKDGMTWTKDGGAWFSYDSEGNRYCRDTLR